MEIYNHNLNKKIDIGVLFERYKVSISEQEVLKYYNSHTRFYHNWEHIISMLTNMKIYSEELVIAIIFHDIIYDVDKNDNEEESALLFEKKCQCENKEFIENVKNLIMATKNLKTDQPNFDEIVRLDRAVLYSKDINELLQWESKIFREYQKYSALFYKEKRIEFLEKAFEETKNDYLKILKEIVEKKVYRIGFYPGSFNPFHIGHYNILLKAEQLFDKVIIGIGKNFDKSGIERNKLPNIINNREMIEYSGLITSAVDDLKVQGKIIIVRGLRNEYDLQYEENLRNAIKDFIPEQDFVYLFCDKEFEHISSSLIRDIISRRDVSTEKFIDKYCLK